MIARLPPIPTTPTTTPQRRCACGGIVGPDGECAACKAKRLALQRKAIGGGTATGRGTATEAVGAVLRAPGQPLAPAVRARMEHRLGHAFSRVRIDPVPRNTARHLDDPGESYEHTADHVAALQVPDFPARRPVDLARVRVHTGGAADTAARATDAEAFTVGNAIAFRAGRYRPQTAAGDRLLAHELTHVAQQSSGGLALQRQSAGDRRMRYRDRVSISQHPTADPMGLWQGTVTRSQILEEYRHTPAQGTTPASNQWQTVQSGSMDATLEFDPRACRVRVPLRLVFHNPSFPAPQNWDPCGLSPANPAPRTPLPNDTYTRLRTDFTATINAGLNGWYAARIDGCASGPCAGRDIPIQVDATDGGPANGRDQDVWLINAAGRSCADQSGAFIYTTGSSTGRRMWVHEGGHFALAAWDEYAEAGQPPERVTQDYSAMGDAQLTRFGTYQQRHFAFVPVFLDHVLQGMGQTGCRTSLREVSRPVVPMFNLGFFIGGARFPGGGGLVYDLGFDTGIPFDRRRDWEGIIGLHAKWMAGLNQQDQMSFLLGVRLGMERRWGGSGHSLALGGFGEIGGGAFNVGGPGGVQWAPYGELGGYLGYRPPLGSGIPTFRLEGAAGSRLDVPGRIGGPEGSLPSLPQENWVRLGVQAAWNF